MFGKKEWTMKGYTLASIKLATAAFVLWLIKIWPAAMTWVHNTNIWWFVVAFVIFAIKPLMEMGGCCKATPVKKKK